jgi:lysophospholipase L1-like esterase
MTPTRDASGGGPTRFTARHAWSRWLLRALFVLVSVEGTLRLGSSLLECFERRSRPGAAEILCVGDSNTYGIGAPPGSSYPDQLQELLAAAGDGRRVANLGVAGFGSRQIVDRLGAALAGGHPSAVLFLGGFNDVTRSTDLLAIGRPALERSFLRRVADAIGSTRTARVAAAAWRLATHDLAHVEFGGASATALPVAAAVPREKWDAEFARARVADSAALADWLQMFWRTQIPERMRTAFDALRARPDFARVAALFHYSLAEVEWELRWLESGEAGALPDARGNDEKARFARYASACRELAGGRIDAARRALDEGPPLNDLPWGRVAAQVEVAWATLLERRFGDAQRELSAALAASCSISPRIAETALLGASLLSHLLASDGARRADAPGYDAKRWEDLYWYDDDPVGREWMAAAELVDAAKGGGAAERAAALARARKRFAEVRTRPLRWLLARPAATFAEIRDGIELEPCRFAWMGICPILFRSVGEAEFTALTAVEHDRLDLLARERGFKVVVLTYLADDTRMINERLRTVAAEKHWTLADVHAAHPLSEIYADDRRRYFSDDRAHPNAAGYALEAKAAFEALRR